MCIPASPTNLMGRASGDSGRVGTEDNAKQIINDEVLCQGMLIILI